MPCRPTSTIKKKKRPPLHVRIAPEFHIHASQNPARNPPGPRREKKAMCIAYFCQQPGCDCIYASGVVEVCPVFSRHPDNGGAGTFSPKLLTSRCRGLDLLFNGVNFLSVDVEGYDVVPDGLDCPDVECVELVGEAGQCPLCDSRGALKFLKAKGIEYGCVAGGAACGSRKEAGGEVAEDAGEKLGAECGDRSVGERVDESAGSAAGRGEAVKKASLVREVVERRLLANRSGGRIQ